MPKPIDLLGMGPKREVSTVKARNGELLYRINVTPPEWSGFTESKYVDLDLDQYQRYVAWMDTGILIQSILPDLSPEEREILISGT
jgi:hypothetical protein